MAELDPDSCGGEIPPSGPFAPLREIEATL